MLMSTLFIILHVSDAFSKSDVLRDWLAPFKKISVLNADGTTEQLVKELKFYTEQLTDIPPGLVTVLRMIKHVCVPPSNTAPGELLAPVISYCTILPQKYNVQNL